MQAEQQSERERFEAWCKLDNPKYQPADDSMQDRRDWKIWQAALSHPSTPQGWKLVPIEPTEDMVVYGFESCPDQFFSDKAEWEKYQAMSGCQQAAHRAKLCYDAMLCAAPSPPEQGSKG